MGKIKLKNWKNMSKETHKVVHQFKDLDPKFIATHSK
jgi:hypothetical protein